MDNVIPMDLKSRLLRLGFNEVDVDQVIWQLGPAATLDNATTLLGIIALRSALREAGFVFKGVDPTLNAETWEPTHD
jgi:hypothetical protein